MRVVELERTGKLRMLDGCWIESRCNGLKSLEGYFLLFISVVADRTITGSQMSQSGYALVRCCGSGIPVCSRIWFGANKRGTNASKSNL